MCQQSSSLLILTAQLVATAWNWRRWRPQRHAEQIIFPGALHNAWNSLPDEVVTAPTLDTFKARLDRVQSKYHYTEDPDFLKNPKLDERKSTIFGW